MRNLILTFLTGMLFLSCNSPRSTEGQTDTTASSKTDSVSTLPDKTPKIFKGLYTYGNEVNTFRNCDNEVTYWVNDSLADMRKTYQKTVQPLPYPYESVYAEVKGYLAGRDDRGYASEYENVLVITEIIKLEAKNLRTECYNYEFIALGNEPFWSLDIIPGEQQIILKDLGAEKVYQLPYQSANIGGGVHRFESTNGAKDKLVVVIREEACSDGMSDNKYNYSAEVTINGRPLKGCAVKKGDNPGKRN